jgi:hypothetical protein
MSERKVITINPELFKTSNGGTRKKRTEDGQQKDIRVRSQPNERNKTTKGRILKYIREQQDKNYKNLFEKTDEMPLTKQTDLAIFNKGFDDSVNYLAALTEQHKHKPTKQNQTLKQYPIQTQSLLYAPAMANNLFDENVSNDMPDIFNGPIQVNNSTSVFGPLIKSNQPNYGCLKNGNLPTYRTWKNQTQKTRIGGQSMTMSKLMEPIKQEEPNGFNNQKNQYETNGFNNQKTTIFDEIAKTKEERATKALEAKTLYKMADKVNQAHETQKTKYLKQKKTLRRTHYVGKSKIFPKVAVLVSNKTIRNNISTKTQLLKQIPIHDVKQFLIKNGFIKVGSIAPNDVLRKMYESVSLICGEVHNHNSDNFLYNYFNAEKI